MSVEDRLRSGLNDEASLLMPRTEEHLAEVGRRHRRRRTVRWGGLVAAAVAATVAGIAVIPGWLPLSQPESPPATVATADVPGQYVVDVAPSSAAEREDMVGRWTVLVTRDGALEIDPPAAYGRATSGAAFELDGDRLTTNALLDHPGCQTVTHGEYRWSFSGSALEFTVVDDSCTARRVLFAGQNWRQVG